MILRHALRRRHVAEHGIRLKGVSANPLLLLDVGCNGTTRTCHIRTSFVEGIEARLSGDYGLRMRNGREYTVTRTYKKDLKDLAQLWTGTDGLPGD